VGCGPGDGYGWWVAISFVGKEADLIPYKRSGGFDSARLPSFYSCWCLYRSTERYIGERPERVQAIPDQTIESHYALLILEQYIHKIDHFSFSMRI
jgi:hypothetical protein